MTQEQINQRLLNKIADLEYEIESLRRIVKNHEDECLPNLEARIEGLEELTGLDEE